MFRGGGRGVPSYKNIVMEKGKGSHGGLKIPTDGSKVSIQGVGEAGNQDPIGKK